MCLEGKHLCVVELSIPMNAQNLAQMVASQVNFTDRCTQFKILTIYLQTVQALLGEMMTYLMVLP